ncbi:hypothetical protein BDZ89DRAFT_961437 [Hymenopellis radicata]|nr:hypothetical protein BDZ89DRAFT_961437 [Hymenopellis radicata]
MDVDGQVYVDELYRCTSCGEFLECSSCSLARHKQSPVHSIRVWRNFTWERTSLTEMGLVFQLGHQGAACRVPDAVERRMTVLHLNGVHTVAFRYCGCAVSDREHHWQQLMRCGWYPATTRTPATCATMELLSFFRRLKTEATVNVRDFTTVLEAESNPYGTEATPDRYKALLRMARQWAFLQRVRRSRIALEEGGLADADDGAVRVECWACPRVGVNLPKDWDKVAEEFRYLYRRVVSTDANFQMKCKMRQSPFVDRPLYSGLGVQMPEEQYHAWLRTYITEEEISNCVAFAALMQKDTKFSVGLRWAGVIGVICGRHELMLGLGDLEKGERHLTGSNRYKNTDFVLYSLLSRMGLKEVTVTYDIACQYRKHFHERVLALPAELRELGLPEITWGLPVWHAGVHDIKCEAAESLKYKVGVGKTDGEGIERVWSVFNPLSYMTREEQPGARADDIEDKADSHNFGKNIGLGQTLLRRLRIALQERAIQIKSFEEADCALADDLRSDWMEMVDAWLRDASKPCPYAPSGTGKEEQEEPQRSTGKKAGKKKKKKAGTRVSMAGFLIMALQIEELQHRLISEKTARTGLTPDRQSKVHERRRTLTKKIVEFRKWQAVYMPKVEALLEEEEERRRERESPMPLAEDVKLYLPSQCTKASGLRTRLDPKQALLDKEAALRRGQCSDALAKIRSRLLAKRYLVMYRNEHVRGQREGGRAAGLIENISGKLRDSVTKYRRSRERLKGLVGEEGLGPFRELLDDDVKVYQTAESDADAVERFKKARKARGRRNVAGETRATMSWIWTAEGGPDAEADEYLHECNFPCTYIVLGVRIEWAKALARKTRWVEEVEILKEEMRRMLRSLRWEEAQWTRRAGLRASGLTAEELAGRCAYARRQAQDRRRVRESFETLWRRTTPSRGQKPGPMDRSAQAAASALIDEEQGISAR